MIQLLRDVGKNSVKGHKHQKAHTTTVGNVCVKYGRNIPNCFRDLLWKRDC